MEASCRSGTIEDVEANAAVDWVMHCLTSRCSLPEDPSLGGADDGSSGRVSYSTISHILLLLVNKLTFRFYVGASASSPTLTCSIFWRSLPYFGSVEYFRSVQNRERRVLYSLRTCKWTYHSWQVPKGELEFRISSNMRRVSLSEATSSSVATQLIEALRQ